MEVTGGEGQGKKEKSIKMEMMESRECGSASLPGSAGRVQALGAPQVVAGQEKPCRGWWESSQHPPGLAGSGLGRRWKSKREDAPEPPEPKGPTPEHPADHPRRPRSSRSGRGGQAREREKPERGGGGWGRRTAAGVWYSQGGLRSQVAAAAWGDVSRRLQSDGR